jgi:hypothetical protein
VDDFLGALRGVTAELGPGSLLSRIFSASLGIAKRRRLNEEIAFYRDRVAAAFPGDAPLRQDARLALAILGRDSLTGTLALSLRAHFEAVADQPLLSRSLPAIPTHTGVPYVDREALADREVDGSRVLAGETVRLALASLEGQGDATRQRFFGGGAHLCLGRPLSIALMERISGELATMPTRVSLRRFALRKDDVFAFPEAFEIEVLA